MTVAATVKEIVDAFLKEYPALHGKVYLTSGSRTWEEQLDIILDPKRKANYKNIKNAFLKHHSIKVLPAKRSALNAMQLAWWKRAIMNQAGKSPGFPHVGGMAQDVSVKNLGLEDKTKLKAKLEKKLHILMEYVTGTKSEYGVSISIANVFHVYQQVHAVSPRHHHN